MKRRDFLKATSVCTYTALTLNPLERLALAEEEPKPEQHGGKIPRRRGFNLLEKFMVHNNEPFLESDFAWMRGWGFDFARLPMDYRCWTDPADPYKFDDKVLGEIDQAVEWGKQYGVHVNLCLHRAPGYTVANPKEKLDLWKDEEAQRQFDHQWTQFARRYKGVSAARLSFDLVNEPAQVSAASYCKVARRVVAAIRKVDPQRPIVSDGLQWGRVPIFELADLGIAQSTRGYEPMQVSHYKATWVWNKGNWPEPTWPLVRGDKIIDREWLRKKQIEPWKRLEAKGVNVHVGEFGVFNKTPHKVAMAWLTDFMGLWKEAGWGWAMWNLRGGFGIVDSDRPGTRYDSFEGHKLDREMLELMQRS
ncbi:MAG: cellulase family glycosylhydrolase [Pirellulales bacterium]|nr:cellulase family glycosylhydrolase [Pirellulales bacterium]